MPFTSLLFLIIFLLKLPFVFYFHISLSLFLSIYFIILQQARTFISPKAYKVYKLSTCFVKISAGTLFYANKLRAYFHLAKQRNKNQKKKLKILSVFVFFSSHAIFTISFYVFYFYIYL